MISFLDLNKINEPYREAFGKKLNQFIERGQYILGEEVELFEQEFAKLCREKHCVGVGNGFDALTLIFAGYAELGRLQRGDEVIVPANTYIASILAVIKAGLVPVFVEPKVPTFNINPKLIQAKITRRTKAILAVNLYGQLCELDALQQIATLNGLLIIEDSAQAHGAEGNGRRREETAAAYSFYPTKNLGALGDGGAVVTSNAELATIIRAYRNYGSTRKDRNQYAGVNSRLDEIQAAFLNLKLPQLEADNARRREIAARYLKEIQSTAIRLPHWDGTKSHVFHLFVVRTPQRDELQRRLLENGIQTMIHYPMPPHKQKALASFGNLSLRITEKIHREVISLPLNPTLNDAEVNYIIETLNNI